MKKKPDHDDPGWGCTSLIFAVLFYTFIMPVIWLAKKIQGNSDAAVSSGLAATVIVFTISTSIFVGGLAIIGYILWEIFG